MGNWTTAKKTTYFNVRLTKDAKHFPANAEKKQPAATFLSIVDGTKDGEDIFIDVKVVRGADRLAGLKKGAEVTVEGPVEFKVGNDGKLRGKIWEAHVELPAATREALKAAATQVATDERLAAESAAAQEEVEGSAPAFE